MKLWPVLLNLIALFTGVFSAFILWGMGHQGFSLGVLLFTGISLLVFTHPRFYLLRFLYPGLVTFLFLMVLPIVSTVLISVSNLSTGHLLSAKEARELIINEKYLPEDAHFISMNLFVNKNKTFIIDDNNFVAEIDPSQNLNKVTFQPLVSHSFESDQALSPREVIDFFEKHSELFFYHPRFADETFYFYRSSLLANTKPIYESHSLEKITNTRTKEEYVLNSEKGRYISDAGLQLSPGFLTWVGLKNYLLLLHDRELRSSFFHVFIWTMVWGVMSVFLSFSLGVTLAIIVSDKNLKLKGLYRGLLILPYSIPFFISVLIFKGMLNKDFGLINEILKGLSLPAIPWLHDALWAKVACLLVNLWLGFPYMFLVTTGILQSIPESIYEAAKLDGAGPWNRFKSITLPLVMSSIAPLLIGSFAFNINNFVGIYLLTGGGPSMEGTTTQVGETDILISYTYRLAFEGGQGQNFGLASSIAVIIFFIVAIITVLNFKLFKTRVDHG